jgi:hypothetical protein
MRLVLTIMENASTTSSESSDDGAAESLELMRSVKEETAAFIPLIAALEKQIGAIQGRAKRRNLLTDAVGIRGATVADWFGAPEATVADFVRKVVAEGTVKTDLESRSLWLQPGAAEALGLPFGQRLGLFDFLRGLPSWLEV